MRIILIVFIGKVLALEPDALNLALDYYLYKDVKYVCYFSCDNQFNNRELVRKFMEHNLRVSVKQIHNTPDVEAALYQWNVAVGVLLVGTCWNTQQLLDMASKAKLFDAMHMWLVLTNIHEDNSTQFIHENFHEINLSVDTDVAVASYYDAQYSLTDVYNFGRIQGNCLETRPLGAWRPLRGLEIYLKGFKYYNRWDFHNLTLRAISVMREQPDVFNPEMLSEIGYTPGVAAMTKIAAQVLSLLKDQHNFRFNYTIAGRWIGEPERNSTLAVTNSLYWGEQDLSCTCARIFSHWLEWVDVYYPPITNLETKFYYLIADKGVGAYEDQFLTPMSPGVWWSVVVTGLLCSLVLAAAALMEAKAKPHQYAFFSVFAAICQQDFEDGIPPSNEEISSQGRRFTLLVVGLTSMLLYNYYTSSVVSWLLNAVAPNIANIDGLINSDLELIFEDMGYTRGWLDNPGFFYYGGLKNTKEDELRDKKVINAKRKLQLLQPVDTGLELVRRGGYAYHTEPYTASEVISKTYQEEDLCNLGSLNMMQPARVYIMSQKRSPYKQFFVWSLMRLMERGHVSSTRARFAGEIPGCSGRKPRALALGQAAPAFLLLLQAVMLSLTIMALEKMWNRVEQKLRIKRKADRRRGWR